ncbi:hypothetical protein NTB88_22575 [Aeromonas salmonicida]|uniref:hypothetical protein n=1 Tax=Staphylococcus sp. HL28 TaxID=2897335 RepID=UPI001E572845|nr:hypothetical protein [Staphylococcus sp. HL28]MCR4455750.1 hypothetical protein [Aeromonas salmonicida]UGB05730.1 hypothetical protein LPC11_09855 [Staphylococcus sp. HL28]
MYELCKTIIEKIYTFATSDLGHEFFKISTQPIATLLLGLFVFLYTNAHHKRTMLNSLDSKSEWRKKLFEIAGTSKITMDEVFQFRASLRFNYKSADEKHLNRFDKMNIIIIKYCKKLTREDNNNEPFCFIQSVDCNDQEIIRLFCRYMLADHWEKNHNRKHKFKKIHKEEELCIYTLQKFILLYKNSNFDNSNFDKLYCHSLKLLDKKTP